MSDLPVLASDYLQTIDRQREVIKALVEALEKLRNVLGDALDDKTRGNPIIGRQILEADSAAIAALTAAKEPGDG